MFNQEGINLNREESDAKMGERMSWSRFRAKLLSKKAVSPIIATLLLIVIAIAAAAIAWAIISGFLTIGPTAPTVYPNASVKVLSCSSSTGQAVLLVTNQGTCDMNITDIKIIDKDTGSLVTITSFTITFDTTTFTSLPAGPIATGKTATVTISASFTQGHTYEFDVVCLAVTPGGSSSTFTGQAVAS